MKSEPDPSHTSVRPRTAPLPPLGPAGSPGFVSADSPGFVSAGSPGFVSAGSPGFVSAGSPGPHRAVGTPNPSLVRRELLQQLSGPDELLVLHAGRFDDAPGLLRSWLASTPDAPTVIACVLDPGTGVSADDYWARLHDGLHPHRSPPACGGNGSDPFAAVLDCLSAQTMPVVLVLEDLHLLPHAVDRVGELLGHGAPLGLRVIVSTRTDTGWSGPLTRSPSRRYHPPSAFRVGPEDISRHLRDSWIDFDVRSAEIICRLTDGLPVLAAAVCGAVPVAEVARPRHLDQHIPAVLDSEVERAIAEEPELSSHRRTLVLSAAADPLNRDALALVPPRDDAPVAGPVARREPMALLDALDRHGMASSSSDGPGGTHWSYPEVIRASLLRLARRDHPTDLDVFRAALIRHWLAADRANDALKVAAASKDWDRVVAIIREHGDTLYTRDYPVTMHDEILARVPEHLVADDPFLRRLRSLHHRFSTPRDTAAPSDSDHDHNDNDDDDDDATVPDAGLPDLFLSALAHRVEGRFAASADLCDRITAISDRRAAPTTVEERDSRAFGWAHIGNSYLLAGRFGQAISALRRSFRMADESFIHRDAAGKLALVHVLLGDTEEAAIWLEEERRHPALPPGTEALVRPAGDVAAALLALDRLDTDAAAEILDDLGPPADREEFWGFILYARAAAALLDGNAASALRFVEKDLLRFSTMRDGGGVTGPLLDAVRADLQLACDRTSAATELLARSPHSGDPLTAPARARAHLLSNDPSAALTIARVARSETLTIPRHAQELDLVAAAASLALGDTSGARIFLASAVATFRMTGSLLPFRGLPSQVMRRLATLAELPVDVPDPGTEFGALTFTRIELEVPSRGDEPGLHPLTQRELAVIRAAATGATTREIAAREFVSANTVKTQLKSVYRKLSVSSRDAAVTVAQERGLL